MHLRSTSEPWESNISSIYTTAKSKSSVPTLTKHQSLSGPYKWSNSSNFHSVSEVNNSELFIGGNVNRELSPVRWCDREVDGVYLNKSGWVQVQQRSLDENRRIYQPNPRRTGIKLANYHFNSEPASSRPAHLSLKEFDRKKTPSPQPESFSPPPITPIISPPPAFQDKNKKVKTFFGKTPFLPRSNAIDSDISPPPSPKPVKWKSMSMPTQKKINQLPPPPPQIKIPQTKSMEDTTTAVRRSLFIQRHESSSSSSSSMGFRSLDSCVNRPVMPRLSENTDSSIDVYEDADEEDNNSSSINMNILTDYNRQKEKISPSNRPNRLQYYRSQLRKTPTVSEGIKPLNCKSPGSSSSSSNEFPSRSPIGSTQQLRRITPTRQQEEQRVRRSRSLQLPDKNYPIRISPQHPERTNIKMGTQVKRHKEPTLTQEDLLREAEIVSNFLYGTRTRAAAQALLMQRYNNLPPKEEKKKERPKQLHRGSTTPNLPLPPKHVFGPQEPHKNPCNSDTCDFWPHCAHRESIMRSSQSYPSHQRSLDSTKRRPSNKPQVFGSSSSSNSDVWLTTSEKTVAKKSSGASTPEDLPAETKREMILTRPGSAPTEERNDGFLESQQRSMSLPKSFLSVSQTQG